jgi:hypothetical protein
MEQRSWIRIPFLEASLDYVCAVGVLALSALQTCLLVYLLNSVRVKSPGFK